MTSVGSDSDHIERVSAFSGKSLGQVADQVNRYSVVTLEIGDLKLACVAIRGRFRTSDLDTVLDMLETDFGIQGRRVNEHGIRLESASHL